jgi:hypothetical protein
VSAVKTGYILLRGQLETAVQAAFTANYLGSIRFRLTEETTLQNMLERDAIFVLFRSGVLK